MRDRSRFWCTFLCLCCVLCAGLETYGQAGSASRRQVAALIASRQFPQALDLLHRLLVVNSKDASLWTLQGVAFDGLGQTAQSLASFRHALLIDCKYLPALEGAAQTAYLHNQAEAMRDVQNLLVVDPHNTVAHAMAGALAYSAHDCPSSITHFEQAGDALLRSPHALSEFSDCLIQNGKAEEAAGLLEQGLAKEPANLQLAYNLAVADLANHNPNKAIDALNSIAEPADSGYLNLLAEAYVEAERPDDAFRTLEKAIALKPEAESNYLDLAILCLEHNKEDMAVSASSAGIGKVAHPASLYLIRGVAYAQLGQYPNAEEDFIAASKMEPDQPHGTIAMSLLLSDRNQLDKEKLLLLQQLQRTPNDAVTNYLLADLLIREGAQPGQPVFNQALNYLTHSLKARPDSVEAQVLMSKMLEDTGDTEGALDHLQAALKADPSNRTALYRDFILLQKLHRKQEASELLQRLKSTLQHDLKKGGAGGQIQIDVPAK